MLLFRGRHMVPTERFGDWCPRAILEFQSFTTLWLFHCFAVSRFHNSSHITHNFSHVTHNPKSKPRLRLFAFGRAEVRVAPTMTKSSVNAISLPKAPLPNAKYRIIRNVRSYFLSFWAIEQICWWAEWILIILDSCPADKLHA